MKLQVIGACGLLLMLTGCGSTSLNETGSTTAPVASTMAARTLDVERTVTLARGWNAVGFPCTNLTGLESSASVQAVSWWDGEHFQTGPATAETIQGAGTWHGFWIYASEETTLAFTGDAPAAPATPLTSGWNLISFSQEVDAATLDYSGSPFTEAASGREATTLQAGVPYWVFSSAEGTLQPKSDHTVRFVNLQAQALVGHPFAVQVEVRKLDGTPDKTLQTTVTLTPTGQTAQLTDSTAIFPAVVLSQPGIAHVTIREGDRNYESADIRVVSPPPGMPGTNP